MGKKRGRTCESLHVERLAESYWTAVLISSEVAFRTHPNALCAGCGSLELEGRTLAVRTFQKYHPCTFWNSQSALSRAAMVL